MKAISASARGAISAFGVDIDIAFDKHPVGQEAEIGLVHAQHVLHRLAGDADLLADHLLAIGFTRRDRKSRLIA
jgi:hypothetical protein